MRPFYLGFGEDRGRQPGRVHRFANSDASFPSTLPSPRRSRRSFGPLAFVF